MMRRVLSVGGDPWPPRTRRIALRMGRRRMRVFPYYADKILAADDYMMTPADAPLRTVTVGPSVETLARYVDNSDGYCACGQWLGTHDYFYCGEPRAVDNSGDVDKYVPVSMADFPQRDRLDAATERMIEACVRRAQRMYFGHE